LILAMANRSPLVYLAGPLVVMAALLPGSRLTSRRLIGFGVLVLIVVSTVGTYRIVTQPAFRHYEEYGDAIARGDYLDVAWTSTSHYAGVVPANAVLVKHLVDDRTLDRQWGR